MADGLQEVLAQTVDGGNGIVQGVLPILIEKVLGGLRIRRMLFTSIGDNFGYLENRGLSPI
jgi:hypothetical protein